MAMVVMMSVMTGLPAAISQEKEIGTMDGMMVAPINRLSIILGKTLGQTARGLLQGIIILVLAVGLFGVTIQGNILLVFGLLLLGVFSFVGLGIVMTSFAKDQQTATMLMTTLMFPMMFLSGVFFPIQQMPWYMQDISKVLPLTYASSALRKVMVLGAGIPDITTELTILIAVRSRNDRDSRPRIQARDDQVGYLEILDLWLRHAPLVLLQVRTRISRALPATFEKGHLRYNGSP